MLINSTILDELSAKAASSERLRMNFDIRNRAVDNSQRMLNAMEPGTTLPIHRHRDTSETLIVLRGTVLHHIYDESGNEIETIKLASNSENIGYNTPAGVWHRSESLEPGTVIFEAKDGKHEPLSETDILK